MKRTIVLSLLLVGALLAAPTAIKIGMLAAPLFTGGGVLVVTPAGAVQVGAIGSGLALTSTGTGQWTLSTTATASQVVGEKPPRNPDGSYSLALSVVPGSLRTFRNGVRQSVIDDYTFDAVLSKIVPGPGWQPDDLVLVDYSH